MSADHRAGPKRRCGHWGWLVATFVALGCGPSYEAVYQGDVRFEHCYRLDHDSKIASSHREYCWKQWVQTYTYGQPQDRIEYAKRRIRVLRGEPPPGLQPMQSESSAQAAPSEPESAKPVGNIPAPAAGGSAGAANSALPGESCSLSCRDTLARCRKGCQTAPKGCAPCEPEYNTCMRACFE